MMAGGVSSLILKPTGPGDGGAGAAAGRAAGLRAAGLAWGAKFWLDDELVSGALTAAPVAPVDCTGRSDGVVGAVGVRRCGPAECDGRSSDPGSRLWRPR